MFFSSDQDSGTILIIFLHPDERLTAADRQRPVRPCPARLRRYAAATAAQSSPKCWIKDNERNATSSFSFII
jgi:hypothetical protein